MPEHERTLTDADITALVHAMQLAQPCNCPFTPEEYSLIKRFVKIFNGTANVIGITLLTAIMGGIIALLTKGFWVSLAQGLSKAGGIK